MKFSRKQEEALRRILHHLVRAEEYLKEEQIAGVAWKEDHPDGACYVIKNPECSKIGAVRVVTTFTGSHLIGLPMARQALAELLDSEPKKEEDS